MNKWIETIEQSVYKLDEYYNKKIDNNKKLEFVVTLLLILGILIEIYLLNKPTPWVSDDLTKSNDLNYIQGWLNHAKNFYLEWGGRVWGELFTLWFLTIPKRILII